MKVLLTLVASTLMSLAICQVKITEKSFENGLTYPQLVYPADSSKYALINSEIYMGVKDLEESAYCVSDYGYVQKGSHIQIQIMCTCMEMDKGELRFFLFNTETGRSVKYSDLFEEKERLKALALIDKKIDDHIAATNAACAEGFNALGEDVKFDNLDVRMTRDGIEIRLPYSKACDESPVRITWNELKNYLKYNFL